MTLWEQNVLATFNNLLPSKTCQNYTQKCLVLGKCKNLLQFTAGLLLFCLHRDLENNKFDLLLASHLFVFLLKFIRYIQIEIALR